jgi:hypothetical protein
MATASVVTGRPSFAVGERHRGRPDRPAGCGLALPQFLVGRQRAILAASATVAQEAKHRALPLPARTSAMRFPSDVATRVSPTLCTIIETMVNDPDREDPPTLDDVRSRVRHRVRFADLHDEAMHPQDRTSVLREIDDLIEEFGGEAPAVDFVAAKASEALSRIIETVMNDPLAHRAPTLGWVRDAMTGGLIARLVGDGTIDPDEDQTLLAEIDALIERYGDDVIAEDFVRFE